LVKRILKVSLGFIEALPNILPSPFVLAVSPPYVSSLFSQRVLSRLGAFLALCLAIRPVSKRIEREILEPLFHFQQAFLKTVLQLGALFKKT
jgi:hypothetical protein